MALTANTSLVVSELNFNSIKTNLRNYLRQQTEFSDYNFENSTISVILDLLAYNTYYNSVYLNMVGNEMFLDTATIRENVVSNAKTVGYVPTSARGAIAQIRVTVQPTDSPNEIIIPAYTEFLATLDGVNYTFSTNEDLVIVNSGGSYSKVLDIYEGDLLTYTFTFNGTQKNFELPNSKIDTSNMKVTVKTSSISTDATEYTKVTDIIDLNSTSTIYFAQENALGNYEVYFGDGVLGKALSTGNVITIICRATNGSIPNDIGTFTAKGYIGYNSAATSTFYSASSITTMSRSSGGDDKESIESIKYNAPKFFARQGRLVVAEDYRSYLTDNYTDLSAVSAWGGEDNDPPIYGKVFISVKPESGFALTTVRKQNIVADIESKSVLSIDPFMVDPIFTFINPTITVTYDPSLTSLTVDALYNKVTTAITTYEEEKLGIFGYSFRRSRFNSVIDNSDGAIVSSDVSFTLEKRMGPVFNSSLSYKLQFSSPFYHPYEGYLGTLSSEGFYISGNVNVCYFDDDGLGKVRVYYLQGTTRVYVDSAAGTIDYDNGIVIIDSITFTELVNTDINELRFFLLPEKADYTPTRNEILLLSYPVVSMFNIDLSEVTKTATVDVIGNISPLVNTGQLTSVII